MSIYQVVDDYPRSAVLFLAFCLLGLFLALVRPRWAGKVGQLLKRWTGHDTSTTREGHRFRLSFKGRRKGQGEVGHLSTLSQRVPSTLTKLRPLGPIKDFCNLVEANPEHFGSEFVPWPIPTWTVWTDLPLILRWVADIVCDQPASNSDQGQDVTSTTDRGLQNDVFVPSYPPRKESIGLGISLNSKAETNIEGPRVVNLNDTPSAPNPPSSLELFGSGQSMDSRSEQTTPPSPTPSPARKIVPLPRNPAARSIARMSSSTLSQTRQTYTRPSDGGHPLGRLPARVRTPNRNLVSTPASPPLIALNPRPPRSQWMVLHYANKAYLWSFTNLAGPVGFLLSVCMVIGLGYQAWKSWSVVARLSWEAITSEVVVDAESSRGIGQAVKRMVKRSESLDSMPSAARSETDLNGPPPVLQMSRLAASDLIHPIVSCCV